MTVVDCCHRRRWSSETARGERYLEREVSKLHLFLRFKVRGGIEDLEGGDGDSEKS